MKNSDKMSLFRDSNSRSFGFNDIPNQILSSMKLTYIETGRLISEQNDEQQQYAHCGGTYMEGVCCTRYWNCLLWKNYCKSFVGDCPK